MKANGKYLVAVALLAVLAVVFGLAGAVAPVPQPAMPQQESSSDSVAHFVNPPTFDSGWMDVTGMAGKVIEVLHNLGTKDVTVDITGRTTLDGHDHQRNLGGTGYIPGWSKKSGGQPNYDQYGCSVVQTEDGGYAIAGNWESLRNYPNAGDPDFWLVKTDVDGYIQWSRTYGGTAYDWAYAMIQTSDGGYAIAGRTDSYGAGTWDFWLVKTDANGNLQWNQTYGGTDWDQAYSLVQTGDGGYAIAGFTRSYGSGGNDAWLVKTNGEGIMEWHRTYGDTDSDMAYSLVQALDGGYAMAGATLSFGAGAYDFWLVKATGTGRLEWWRTYGGSNSEFAYSLILTEEGYAMAGYTESFGSGAADFWVVRTDIMGNFQWGEDYGGPDDDEAYSVIHTSDGGYAIAGHTKSFGTGGDFWLVKTNAEGAIEWNRTFSEERLVFSGDYYGANPVIQTSDGGYAMVGSVYKCAHYTLGYGQGEADMWLVKTGVEHGLAMIDLTNNVMTLYRGATDPYWNYVRVRIWTIEEPTWQFGDIDMDGDVDYDDFIVLAGNYGKTYSALSLGGIAAIAGIYVYKKRKQPK